MKPDQIKIKAMCVVVRNGTEVLAGAGHDDVKNEDFGRIIGGHVEFGETSEAAVQREFQEELGTKLENLKLIQVIENIFTYNGKPGHEIVFVYKGDLSDKSLYTKDKIEIIDARTSAVWFTLEKILNGKCKVYPDRIDYSRIQEQI